MTLTYTDYDAMFGKNLTVCSASVTDQLTPTYADRMALALCSWRPATCASPYTLCRAQSAAHAHEIARQLRKRHGGSSQVADWLDGVGCHA